MWKFEVNMLERKEDLILKFDCPKCLKFETQMLLKNTINYKEKIITCKYTEAENWGFKEI